MPISIGTGLTTYYAPVAAGSPPATAFATDTFTDTDGVALTAHTASDGGTWSLHTGTSANIQNNRLYLSGTTLVYHSAVPPSADYSVSVDCVIVTDNSSSQNGPAGRMSTSANTCYFARINQATDQYELYKTVTGTSTNLGTGTAAPTSGTVKLTLDMVGTTIRMLVNDIQIYSVTDSGIALAGRAGFRNSGTASATAGLHFDNFSAIAA